MRGCEGAADAIDVQKLALALTEAVTFAHLRGRTDTTEYAATAEGLLERQVRIMKRKIEGTNEPPPL